MTRVLVAGVRRLLTTDSRDFARYGVFEVETIESTGAGILC